MDSIMKYIHYIFVGILFFIGVLISIVLCEIPGNFLKLIGKDEAATKLYWRWAPRLAHYVSWLLGARVHIEGLENLPKDQTNAFYICNHQSLLDICVIIGYLKIKASPVAKVEVLKAPFVRSLAKGVHTILLDRKSAKSSIKAILDGTNMLKKGGSVIIFPEGTRSKTGKLGTFKAGSYKMGLRAQSTVIPLVVQGTRSLLESKKGWKKYDVYLKVLEPVSAKGLSKEEQKEFPAKISSQIEKEYNTLPEYRY